jgi:hypothetical protein
MVISKGDSKFLGAVRNVFQGPGGDGMVET